MAKAKTELSNELVYGIDEKNRRVYFGVALDHQMDEDGFSHGDFNQLSVTLAIRAIHRMALEHPKTPIEIHMNSYGGDTYAMLYLHDVIQDAPCQIKFFGGGAIMSAATFIMAACDERHLYPNARIMVHELRSLTDEKYTNIKIDTEECDALMNTILDIYTNNSRMAKSFWQEATKRDLYLSAEETIQLGLADRVMPPKKRGNYRKIRQYHLSRKINVRKMNRLVETLLNRIHAIPKKFVVEIKTPLEEPVDDKLIIEPLQEDLDEPQSSIRQTEEKQEESNRKA